MPLNILIVEDSQDDADLSARELRNAGFEVKYKRVETEPDFLAELQKKPDIILSDYSMPQFNGLRAAELVRESGLDIPFILISGTVGEEIAVEAMRHGATDYLLKDRMARLAQAVERALREARERAERKHLHEEVALRERQLKAFFTGAVAGLSLMDQDLRFVQINDTLAEMNGLPAREHLGRTVREILPKFAPLVEPFLQQVLDTGKAILNVETSGETPLHPGVQRHWLESFFPIFGKDGKVECVGAIVVETTQQKRTAENLRESELKFRQIAENIREVFWVTDPAKSQMLYISPAYETIWGRTCQSLYDSPQAWIEAIHSDDRDRVLTAAMTKQQARNFGSYDEEYRILRPDGEVRWIHDRAFPVRDAAGEIYRVVGVAEDITDRRKLEEQFRQAQKMEAIGQLAGGVAHDFNNLLAVIQMSCGLMRAGGELSAEQAEYAEGIAAAAQRAAALTRQLLLFSRREIMQPRNLDLNQSINNLTKMLQRIVGEDIQVQFRFTLRPLFVHADPGMIDQVVMNLVVNSRDAMPKGGRLVLETSAAEIDELAAAQSPSARPGFFACVSVSDTGCGIPAENLPRIFEPFFTTKEAGKGTGLGLATVFGIVQQHRGWITVYSEVGRGTTFRIYLPVTQPPQQSETESVPERPVKGGTETILLVEDEAAVRGLVRGILTRYGYEVIEARSGAIAMEAWREHRGRIALLITDIVMPGGISGLELAKPLRAEKPSLRVIYTSGYSPEIVGKNSELSEGVNFLQKPYSMAKLARIVRDAFDQ